MEGSDLLFGFMVMSVIMFGPFLLKSIKEAGKEVAKNTSIEYRDSKGILLDTELDNFLKMRDTHIHLCEHFINMIKTNATDEDISFVLEEMEHIRCNDTYLDKIDIVLFPAMIDLKQGVNLFNYFQAKIKECEYIGNIPKGYAYMAWSITLVAHINNSLNFYGPMLWGELRRGYTMYSKNTGKEWKQIPRF